MSCGLFELITTRSVVPLSSRHIFHADFGEISVLISARTKLRRRRMG